MSFLMEYVGIPLLHLDQYQYLGNCPPTPPLTQQQSVVNVGLGEG